MSKWESRQSRALQAEDSKAKWITGYFWRGFHESKSVGWFEQAQLISQDKVVRSKKRGNGSMQGDGQQGASAMQGVSRSLF